MAKYILLSWIHIYVRTAHTGSEYYFNMKWLCARYNYNFIIHFICSSNNFFFSSTFLTVYLFKILHNFICAHDINGKFATSNHKRVAARERERDTEREARDSTPKISPCKEDDKGSYCQIWYAGTRGVGNIFRENHLESFLLSHEKRQAREGKRKNESMFLCYIFERGKFLIGGMNKKKKYFPRLSVELNEKYYVE